MNLTSFESRFVCAHILVPKKPNLGFVLLFLCFFYTICLCLVPFGSFFLYLNFSFSVNILD